jgi:hypothetical protein
MLNVDYVAIINELIKKVQCDTKNVSHCLAIT